VSDDDDFERYWIQCSDDATKAGFKPNDDCELDWGLDESPCRWRPAIHMPRWASRITLSITRVEPQRVSHVAEAGAVAEGFDSLAAFHTAWDAMYSKRGLCVAKAPWCWVAWFEKAKENEHVGGKRR